MKAATTINRFLLTLTAFLLLAQIGRGDAKLDEAIRQFAKDKPGRVSLGMFCVVDSDTVETVLSYHERAIPALKQALKSSNPLIVAQAAWCLDSLKAKEAIPEVWTAYRRFHAIPKPRSWGEQYAVERTAVFLSRYANAGNIESLV